MKKEVSAGGVVFRKDKILLIKDSYGRWALPKGHIEKGETAKRAALREITEETGLKNIRIVKSLGDIHYFYMLNKEKISKTLYIFLVESKDSKLKIQEEEIEDAGWFDFREALERFEYRNSKRILEKAIKDLSKLPNSLH